MVANLQEFKLHRHANYDHANLRHTETELMPN